MQRRNLLAGAASFVALAFLDSRDAHASQSCGPVSQSPYPPPHGIQQCTAGIQALRFMSAFQQADEWCWAACISMVFNYYGHPVTQQRIVAETWGAIVNMPAQNDDILNDLNRVWQDDNGRRFRSMGDMVSVNASTAVTDLIADQPLIIGAVGHATVLTAITSNVDLMTGQWQIVSAIVRDPWPTNGSRRVLSPHEWNNIQFAARIRIQG